MDFKYHLEKAWNMTLKNIASLLILTLVMGLIGVASLGVLAPVLMAGYMQSILLLVRSGREPKVQDLFTEMGLFLPLLSLGLAVVVVTLIGFSIFFLPGILFACGITFVCLYLFPLMTDRKYGIVDALKRSYQIVTGNDMRDHMVVAIIVFGISAIGSSVAIGWLITQPLATVFRLSVDESCVANGPSAPPAPEPPPPPGGASSEDGWTIREK